MSRNFGSEQGLTSQPKGTVLRHVADADAQPEGVESGKKSSNDSGEQTATGVRKHWASGTFTFNPLTITGLSFAPSKVVLFETTLDQPSNHRDWHIFGSSREVLLLGTLHYGLHYYRMNKNVGVDFIDANLITSNGFMLPAVNGNYCKWYAWD